MTRRKIVLALVVLVLVYLFFALDLAEYFSLDFFKSRQAEFDAYYATHPAKTAALFFLIYVAVTGLSLPGATILTLVAGAIFGLFWGTVLVSFASTIGATIAFLVSRFLLQDVVQNRFGESLNTINDGIEKDGAFYLFTLRLVPAFPFFVINLVMGLTPIRTVTFALVSQVGMLAGTVVYVNAGTQIAQLESLSGILSPGLIASFTLLGIFPLVAKKAAQWIRAHKVLKPFARPQRFDRDVVVIGAGSGGLVAAYIAAAVKAKVTLVEKHKMGGDCLNTGCVPSKALLRTAKFLHQARRSQELGIERVTTNFDFADVMDRVQRVIRRIEPHDSVERYTKLGVECELGEARIVSPYEVEVNGRLLSTRNIVVATGGRPFVPPIPGIDDVGYLTSDTVWDIRERPGRLIVLGGGPIGCELAQAFQRLGCQVVLVEMLHNILIREDQDVSDLLATQLREEGVELLLNHKAGQFRRLEDERKILVCEHAGNETEVEFDQVIVAVGRRANTSGYGLEELGVDVRDDGTLEVNEYMQTRFPNILACGDVTGPYQFTHMASHQAWYASVNGLFGDLKRFRADYSVVPWCTFTDPEVARVGLNELEAREKGVRYEVTRYGIDDLDRAIADGAAHGFVKVLTEPGDDRILGCTIVGEHAGDLIAEFVAAMRHGYGLEKILATIHIYPTLAEANKYVAGQWKRDHAPQQLLSWVERYHAWRRNDRIRSR